MLTGAMFNKISSGKSFVLIFKTWIKEFSQSTSEQVLIVGSKLIC